MSCPDLWLTGECSCEDGYTDTDCGVNLNHVPVLNDLPFSGLCDVSTRACADFPVFGDLFVEVHNISCRVIFKTVSTYCLLRIYAKLCMGESSNMLCLTITKMQLFSFLKDVLRLLEMLFESIYSWIKF